MSAHVVAASYDNSVGLPRGRVDGATMRDRACGVMYVVFRPVFAVRFEPRATSRILRIANSYVLTFSSARLANAVPPDEIVRLFRRFAFRGAAPGHFGFGFPDRRLYRTHAE